MEKGLRNISTTSQLLTHLSPYLLMTRRTTTRIICNTLFIIFSYCLCLFDAANVEQLLICAKDLKENSSFFFQFSSKHHFRIAF